MAAHLPCLLVALPGALDWACPAPQAAHLRTTKSTRTNTPMCIQTGLSSSGRTFASGAYNRGSIPRCPPSFFCLRYHCRLVVRAIVIKSLWHFCTMSMTCAQVAEGSPVARGQGGKGAEGGGRPQQHARQVPQAHEKMRSHVDTYRRTLRSPQLQPWRPPPRPTRAPHVWSWLPLPGQSTWPLPMASCSVDTGLNVARRAAAGWHTAPPQPSHTTVLRTPRLHCPLVSKRGRGPRGPMWGSHHAQSAPSHATWTPNAPLRVGHGHKLLALRS